jgi:serine phosphatase RsbU (regulator of sigma subunit)
VNGTEPGHEDALASRCQYAVCGPVVDRCAMASAGHPPPGLLRPDGTFDRVGLDPGPPLRVGGLPFEVTEPDVPPGSILALCTEG